MEATMSKKTVSPRSLKHLAYFKTRTFRLQPTPHPIIPHYSLMELSCMMEGAWRDPSSLSWLPHWSDVEMIPEEITFKSMKRALPKPTSHSMQSEGLTKSSHIQSEGLTKLPHSYYSVDGLNIYPFNGPYESLSPSLTKIPQHQNTHTDATTLSGALPEPLHFLCSQTSFPMIGPYQTPTSPTKTDQLKKEKTM